jgi:hypothetical protein
MLYSTQKNVANVTSANFYTKTKEEKIPRKNVSAYCLHAESVHIIKQVISHLPVND